MDFFPNSPKTGEDLYADKRLRLLLNPGSLEKGYAWNRKSDNECMDDVANICEKKWLPELVKLLGDEEEAKRIVNYMNPDFSNATLFGYNASGRLDINEIDKYFQDAFTNGGFLCSNGKRIKTFQATEFAQDLGAALNQLNFIGVTNIAIHRINIALDPDSAEKFKAMKYLRDAYYNLRGPLLTEVKSPIESRLTAYDSWCSYTAILSSALASNKFDKNQFKSVLEAHNDTIDPNSDPKYKSSIRGRALERVYQVFFGNGIPTEPVKGKYLATSMNPIKKLEAVVTTFNDELSTFLNVPISVIEGTIKNSKLTTRV